MFTSWKEPIIKDGSFDFVVYQPEIAPKTKKLHYQGYIEFKLPKRLNECKKCFHATDTHFEVRRGTQQQAIDYCTKILSRKDGCQPVIIGEPKNQGERSDITSMYESLLNGATPKEILHVHGGNALRYMGAITKAAQELWELDGSVTMKIREKRAWMSKLGEGAYEFAIQLAVGDKLVDREWKDKSVDESDYDDE